MRSRKPGSLADTVSAFLNFSKAHHHMKFDQLDWIFKIRTDARLKIGLMPGWVV